MTWTEFDRACERAGCERSKTDQTWWKGATQAVWKHYHAALVYVPGQPVSGEIVSARALRVYLEAV